MPNFVRVWNHVVSVVTGFFSGDDDTAPDPCTWLAHETDQPQEATWDDYSATGANPTTWEELVCPVLVDGDSNQLTDQEGNKLTS